MAGMKHLIQCHCILPQYRKRESPLFHKFVVFSKIDENGNIISKLSKCNNCDSLHKITDFCKSEIIPGQEDTVSVILMEDVANEIPEKITQILEKHMCDLPTYEQVLDIIKCEEWNVPINISKINIGSSLQIKTLIFSDRDSFKIESHLYEKEI